MNSEFYFDWAATSPADSEILKEALDISMENFGNPSSVHKAGMEARNILENARRMCAETIGVNEKQLFFTSGGTESDHIPLLSMINKPERGRIILSGIEHPALREEVSEMKNLGFDVVTVNPDKNGFISPDSISEKLTTDTLFVTVMAVNNETGCVQPVYEIAKAIETFANGKRKPHFHIDCVQAAGKVPLRINAEGIDSAAFCAHKICGPRGIGLLYLKSPEKIRPFLKGGGQENGIRSGTENLFGAVALSKVLKKYYINEENNTEPEKIERLNLQRKWTANFISSILENKNCILVPEIRKDLDRAIQDKFSPWVVQAAFRGIPGNVMVRALNAKGFFISTGSACSSKKQNRPVLSAMNSSRDVLDSAVRFSFGPTTTEEAMKKLAEAVRSVCADF